MTTATAAGLSPMERLDRVRLCRSQNVGPITFHQLMGHFGSARAALEALPELARHGGRRKRIRVCGRAEAERELAGIEACGAAAVIWGDAGYPALLAAIEDAPPLISLKGHPHLLGRRAVSVVGARNASANGRRFARGLARDLGAGGLVVTSGLARGIDAEAHLGALESGTVAIVAGGVDVIYPEENKELYERIAAAGAIVSEQPPGTVPLGRHFPRRNRLISGLSLGVVVVEAAPRSGSLITARMALEQGREVFGVPGPPQDPRSRGSNDLIRQGAVLTETADDVFRTLEGVMRTPLAERRDREFAAETPPAADEAEVDALRAVVIERLGPSPVPVDELLRQCGAAPAAMATVLLELELAGRLERQPGNQVALVAD